MESMTYVAFNWANKAVAALDKAQKRVAAMQRGSKRVGERGAVREGVREWESGRAQPSNATHFAFPIRHF